jgi:hypothetical protein
VSSVPETSDPGETKERKAKPPWPVTLWRKAVRESDLPSTTKLVALTLSDYMDNETLGNAFPGNEWLARGTGLNEKTVREHLKVLKRAGFLDQVHHGGRGRGANVYVGRFPKRGEPRLEQTVPESNSRNLTTDSRHLTPEKAVADARIGGTTYRPTTHVTTHITAHEELPIELEETSSLRELTSDPMTADAEVLEDAEAKGAGKEKEGVAERYDPSEPERRQPVPQSADALRGYTVSPSPSSAAANHPPMPQPAVILNPTLPPRVDVDDPEWQAERKAAFQEARAALLTPNSQRAKAEN